MEASSCSGHAAVCAAVRPHVLHADDAVYFANAGFPLKLRPAMQAAAQWTEFQARGPGTKPVLDEMYYNGTQMERTRDAVAGALGCTADEVMLSECAGVGANVVGQGIDWQPGDAVVLCEHEHPSNLLPWFAIAKRHGVTLLPLHDEVAGSGACPRPTPDAELAGELRRILAAARERSLTVRLLSLSHVSRRTGARLPVAALAADAHAHDAAVFVDGAQAFGVVPVDVRALGADFYAINGHKYSMGPSGTGALFVARERLESVLPSFFGCHGEADMMESGWGDVEDAGMRYTPLPSARRFEFGTRNVADQIGWRTALELWEGVGWEAVFGAVEELTDYLKSALQDRLQPERLALCTPRRYAQSASIVGFGLTGLSGDEIERALASQGVLVGAVTEGAVRLALHVYNTTAEVDLLVETLVELCTSTSTGTTVSVASSSSSSSSSSSLSSSTCSKL
eukprot:SAG22_NODE_873_length_6721_cov_19.182395_1_plen_454_part_00